MLIPRLIFSCHLAFSFFASTALCQNPPNANPNPPTYYGASERVDGAHIPPIPNASFSAKAEVETAQALPDGTTVTRRTYNIIARDFRGRTHNEMRGWILTDGSEPKLTYSVLYDPNTRAKTYVYPSSRLARQFILKQNVASSDPTGNANNPLAPSIQKEELGADFQDGLQLTGIRETTTYPPGSMGNDRSLAITNEYWYSSDLHLNISVKRTDPRFGTQTVRLTNLRREEPDPSLFEVPVDYKLVNENGPEGSASNDENVSFGHRVRIGGNVQAAKILDRVHPAYPEVARQNRIQGVVRLHVIVGKDGTVGQIEVLSGHPLLVQAALDAVRQWRYQPTLLRGEAVEVDTTVDVIFALNKTATPTP